MQFLTQRDLVGLEARDPVELSEAVSGVEELAPEDEICAGKEQEDVLEEGEREESVEGVVWL